MATPSGSTTLEAQPSIGQVHVIGAGPVGLLLTALLQDVDGLSVSLYEKRNVYTRTRMVQLASYLLADSVEAYCTDAIDADSISAIFDAQEIADGIAARQAIAPDLMTLLRGWSLGFCPLNSIERAVSDLIDAHASSRCNATASVVTVEDAIAMVEPGSIVIDCTGSRSLLRDHLVPTPDQPDGEANTHQVRLEYALVVTFLYGQPYDATNIASTTRTSRTRTTSSSRWSTARTTTAASAT
jgi:2-polyprenyl-6-methoxyphenol hydroxylase-like FAD-dependent oxidoreductase